MAGNLSIGTAWTEAAAFVRSERRLIAPVVMGLVTVPAVIASMVQPPVAPGEKPEPGLWLVVVVLMILATVLGQLAIALLASGWRASVGDAIRRAAKRFPTLLLAGLAVMVPLFVFLTITMLLAGTESAVDGTLAQARFDGGSALAVVLFVATMLFVAVRLLPLMPIIATGDLGPVDAIKHSFRLTRGHFWKLFGFVLLLSVAFVIAAAAVAAVVGMLVTLAFGRPEPWSVSFLLIALVGGLVQAAFVTVYTAMVARITIQLEGTATSGI